jgi:hypothetical protein
VATIGAMKDILPDSTLGCEDKRDSDDPGIAIWWNEDGTRRGAWFECCAKSHDQDTAVDRWERVATAG